MKMTDTIRETLGELNPEALTADGLDGALIGYVERFGMPPIALYDREKVIRIFMSEGSTREDAEEHFSFNVIGGWVGEGTPAFATIIKEERGEEGRGQKRNKGRVYQRRRQGGKRPVHDRHANSRHR
jgi:hypothetical protein